MKSPDKLKLLAVSIGLIFFYFGFIKFFPALSPAEEIGTNTVSQLCMGILPDGFCIKALATLEVFIGLSLITGKFYKTGIILAIGHLIMTFSPMILFPNLTFNDSVFSPSLLGQYIFKNIILIMALWVLYPTKNTQTQTL